MITTYAATIRFRTFSPVFRLPFYIHTRVRILKKHHSSLPVMFITKTFFSPNSDDRFAFGEESSQKNTSILEKMADFRSCHYRLEDLFSQAIPTKQMTDGNRVRSIKNVILPPSTL